MDEEKMNNFIEAVMKDATEQQQHILDEVEKEKAAAIEKKEEEILNAIYHRIQAEVNNIKHSSSRTISLHMVEMRRDLLKRRDEITARVFKELEVKLNEFVDSESYDAYLKKILSGYTGEQITVFCKPSHIERVKRALGELSLSADVQPDMKIKIGGVVILFNDKAQRVNESIDSKLLDQYEYFNLISGLTIS